MIDVIIQKKVEIVSCDDCIFGGNCNMYAIADYEDDHSLPDCMEGYIYIINPALLASS